MSGSESKPKFTVAIIGGGIGGLTAAIALSRSKDMHIDIYEAASKFTEIGAGVGMWPRPWKVMKALGLEDALRELVDVPDENTEQLAFQLRKSDQPEGLSFYDLYAPMGALTFHRADFQRTLAAQLDPATTAAHFGKRLVSYAQPADGAPGAITLRFKDGSEAACDVLVGADGIHSATRAQLLRDAAGAAGDAARAAELLDMIDPVWSGTVAYRGVVPRATLAAAAPGHRTMRVSVNYMGKDKHVIAFPISHGALINVVAFCSEPGGEGARRAGRAVEDRPRQELLDRYAGWEPEVVALLECIDKPSLWNIDALKGLPICTHGRVALLGDAAHAMTPHQGSGAGQAIEDAYILATALAHARTTLRTARVALRVYEAVRLPHGNDVLRRSRASGRLYEFADPRFAALAVPTADAGALAELGREAVETWEWAWRTSVDGERERALEMLEGIGA